jgi:glycerophosphoryl diester phosphodiesterase
VARWPLVSWHRGGDELAPSATAAAFSAAAARGAELVEVDVRQSADGVLVCVHDPSLGGLGEVSALRYGDLDASSREEILTFEGFLDLLDDADPGRGTTGVHLDLKAAGFELAAADALRQRGRRFLVTTALAPSIALLRSSRPDLDAYLTIGSSRQGLSAIAAARLRLHETLPMSAIARCHATGVAAHHLLLTPMLRRWCRRRGLATLVWTVDRAERIDEWLRRDVDVLTTNRPLLAIERRAALAR